MNRKSVQASQVLKQAKEALQRGEKHEARYWAQIAVSLVPDMEDPWLILAAVANPRASIAYLERALEINPKSERTQEELDLARRKRLNEKKLPVSRAADTSPAQVDALSRPKPVVRKERRFSYTPTPLRVLIFALFLIAVSAFWAGSSFSALAAAHSRTSISSPYGQIHYWSQAYLPKPTYTPLPVDNFNSNPESNSNHGPVHHICPNSFPVADEHFTAFREAATGRTRSHARTGGGGKAYHRLHK